MTDTEPKVRRALISDSDKTGVAEFASCNLGGTNNCPGGTVPTVVFSTNTVTDVTGNPQTVPFHFDNIRLPESH